VSINAGGTSVNLGEGGIGVNVPGARVDLGQGNLGVDVDVPGVNVQGAAVLVDTDLIAIELPEIDVPGVVVKEGPKKVVYAVSGDVLFDFDSAEIRPSAEQALAQIAESLSERYPGKRIRIEGHTDDKGSDSYNLKLSKRRAEAVREWLESEGGWDSEQAQVVGLGETHPVAQNQRADGRDDPAGRQLNRRVEIVVLK
jgi:outer membrane protein OmpA-like peptidoglycan-associated protein